MNKEELLLNPNIKKYFIYRILKRSLPIWFIFFLYLKGKGLSYTEILLLDSVSAGVCLLFEVPSGVLADRISRKSILIIGEILLLLNYIILFFPASVYQVYILGACLSGIGTACISGAGEAMIYEMTSKAKGEEKGYLHLMANMEKWGLRCVAVITLCTSFFYNIWTEIPIIITIVFEINSIILLLLIDEQAVNKRKNKIGTIRSFKIQIIEIKNIFSNRKFFSIIILFIILQEIISNLYYSAQVFLPNLGLPVKYLGCMSFVFNIIASFGAKRADKIKLKGMNLIALYGGILICISFANLYITILLLSCSRFISGFLWPILGNEINGMINTENRATILSCQSLLLQIAPLFLDPLIGLCYDNIGMDTTYLMMGIVLLIMLSVCSVKSYIYNASSVTTNQTQEL